VIDIILTGTSWLLLSALWREPVRMHLTCSFSHANRHVWWTQRKTFLPPARTKFVLALKRQPVFSGKPGHDVVAVPPAFLDELPQGETATFLEYAWKVRQSSVNNCWEVSEVQRS
jgi:hypothetical protein